MRVQLGKDIYWWDGKESLSVGDWVLVPPTTWAELLGWCSPRAKQVTAVGGEYGGDVPDDELMLIIRKLAPGETYAGSVPSKEETTR